MIPVDRFRNLTNRQRKGGLVKLFNHSSLSKIAQIAIFSFASRVFAHLTGHFAKVFLFQAFTNFFNFLQNRLILRRVFHSQQDMLGFNFIALIIFGFRRFELGFNFFHKIWILQSCIDLNRS